MENEVKTTETVEEIKEPVKTYTHDEVEKMINQEADRRATKAVQTNTERLREQWAIEYEQKVQKEKELATLSAEERTKKELSERATELENKEKLLKKQQLKFEAGQELFNRGLPSDFLDWIVSDADTNQRALENIHTFESKWQEALEKTATEKLRGKPPTAGHAVEKNPFAKGQINLTEQGKLLKENPSLAKKLMAEA